jgi:hypothetical protein
MRCFQPFPSECCWWMRCSHRMTLWILARSTHGLMKFHKHDSSSSLQCKFGQDTWPSWATVSPTWAFYFQFLSKKLRKRMDNGSLPKWQWWSSCQLFLGCNTILGSHYPDRWKGWNRPVAWPLRSPNLIPFDYCVWDHLKTTVYVHQSNTWDKL